MLRNEAHQSRKMRLLRRHILFCASSPHWKPIMQTFNLRDLSLRADELTRDVEAGKLSVVTQDGQPIFVVVPFDETLVREGVNVTLAIKLFDEETISLSKAARLAGMGVVEFMDILAALRIPVARPLPGELEKELENFG